MTNSVVSLHRTILYVNAGLSFAGNSLLVYLILFHTKSNIGNYRHLMIIFAGGLYGEITNTAALQKWKRGEATNHMKSRLGTEKVFEFSYSLMHVLVSPELHTQGNCFLVVYDGLFVEYLDRSLQAHLAIAYCGFFAQSLVILAYHFIYRYIVVCRPHMIYIYQKWQYIFCLIILYAAVPCVWDLICALMVPMTSEKDEFVKDAFEELYNSSILQRGYCGPMFRSPDDGSWVPREILGIAILFSITTVGLSVILIAAKRIYTVLNSVSMSANTQTLQRQLFRVLIVQTTIPVCCAHIPGYALFLGAAIGSDYKKNLGYFLSIAISSFPVIDPLIMLYFLTDYRTAILKFFGFKKTTVSQTVSTFNPTFAGTSVCFSVVPPREELTILPDQKAANN